MSALHHPMKAKIAEHMVAVTLAAEAGNVDDAIFSLLDVFAAIGRDVAQTSWLKHYDVEARDDLMSEDGDELVFTCLKAEWSKIYPELPGQVEGVLRDAFDDEHFRLEDPLGWAEMNSEGADRSEALG